MLLAIGLIMLLVFGGLVLGIGDIAILGSQNNPTAEPVRSLVALTAAVPLLIPCMILPPAGVLFGLRLLATIQTFQGKNFHYPWLGTMLERSMGF